jgi:hypothetical protein
MRCVGRALQRGIAQTLNAAAGLSSARSVTLTCKQMAAVTRTKSRTSRRQINVRAPRRRNATRVTLKFVARKSGRVDNLAIDRKAGGI